MQRDSRILDSIFKLALQRDSELNDLAPTPTIRQIDSALQSLPESLPVKGLGDDQAFDLVQKHLLPALAQGQSGPRYFGFVIGGVLPAAQYGDFLTTIYDQNAGMASSTDSISSAIEHRALLMLLQLLSLPADVFQARTLTTGATAANVLGLACGRDHAVRVALGGDHSVAEHGFGGASITVFSDRAHASLIKAASIVGVGRANVVQLGSSLRAIEEQLQSCAAGSGKGAIIALTFGEVNTGEFTSDVGGIRSLCDKYSTWLHIDGAFGAFARLSPSLQHMGQGLELADSIACDGHKWLNVPYDCGIFYSRSIEHQSSVFGSSPSLGVPAYLKPAIKEPNTHYSPQMEEVFSIPPPYVLGIENSRRFRALALYCALISTGAEGYRGIVERNVKFARDIAEWMSSGEGKQWYEVLNLSEIQGTDSSHAQKTVPLNIILFWASSSCPKEQFRPSNPQGGSRLLKAINDSKTMFLTPGPGGALRLAVSNWMTGLNVNKDGETDLEIVVRTLKSVMVDLQ